MSKAESLFSNSQDEDQTTSPHGASISTGTISDVADATTAIMQVLNVPPEHYPFVQAVIGAADGRVDWFGCRDRVLGARALGEDTRSTEAVKKWVQRRRDAWCDWQSSISFVLIECDPGGKRGDDFLESRYRAHILSYIHKCVEIANPALQGEQGRVEAFKLAAWRVLPTELKQAPEVKSRHERFNRPRTDVEAEINKHVKMALTYLRKAAEGARACGGDPSTLINNHIRAAKELVPSGVHTKDHNKTYGHTGGADSVSAPEGGTMDTSVHPPHIELDATAVAVWASLEDRLRRPAVGQAVDTSVHPPTSAPVAVEVVQARRASGDPNDVLKRNAERAAEPPPAPIASESPATEAVDAGVHGLPDAGATFEDAVAPAEFAVDLCASVGMELFKVLRKDDVAVKVREVGDFDRVALRARIVGYVEQAEREQRSLIVDLKANGRRVIQFDEASREVIKLLAPYSFMGIGTSEGNGQMFLALPEGTSDEACEAIKERLFARLRPLGANGGSGGGLRWPGSINFKPNRGAYRVRLIHARPGRTVTVEELTNAGLLPPVLPNLQLAPTPKSRAKRAASWPDYDRCVREAKRKDDGISADMSAADDAWCILALDRGWPDSEVEAKLKELRDKARRRPAYARRTVAHARTVVNSRA